MVSAINFIDCRVTGEVGLLVWPVENYLTRINCAVKTLPLLWHHVLAVLLDSINRGQESGPLGSSLSAPDGGYNVSSCSKLTHYILEPGAEINGVSCAAAVG